MKLLIVEDNVKLGDSLKRGLVQEGYAVDVLTDGDAGLRRLSTGEHGYDAVILDVMLPGKSGIEIAEALRAKSVMVPILMLTAKDTIEDRIEGLDSGADDYLIKPFAFHELLARIRALLRRPPAVLPSTLTCSGIVLDGVAKKVTVDGASIALTLREYSVLEYLMRHPNQVLSREDILSNVWDFSFDSFSNVVDVHIKNLRKKLGDGHGASIETLRGVGYRLNA